MIIGIYPYLALVDVADAQVKSLSKVTVSGNKFNVFSETRTKSGVKCEVVYWLYQPSPVYEVHNIRLNGASLVTTYRNQFVELIK